MNTQSDPFVSAPLEKIVYNQYQPRSTMDPAELQTLAESIQRNGLMQKPTARLRDDGCYELAFGHRRLEAYKILAGRDGATYQTMPLIVRDLTDQQMFEFAWEENREREDLNPVDQGEAYATYMRVFNATSKQAGAYFRVSEETIRQKQRYGKLPDVVKEKMRKGEVNENTGRALLSMQKVASDDVIVKTVERIEKNREEATPEQVIEQVVDRLENAVEMWPAHRDGKPRAGSGLWLLDMKSFPNKLLPAMSVEAVGAYESQIDHLVEPPSCTACPFYTKIRGSHYCGLKICHERKTVAWERHQIEQASRQLGIAIYTKDDGAYAILRSYDAPHIKLFEKRHESLRLMPKSDSGQRYGYQRGFRGVDDDLFLVVATGDAIKKMGSDTSVKSNVGKKTEKEKAEMRMMKVYRRRRKDLMWEFTAVASSIFYNVPVEALKTLHGWKFTGIENDIRDEWKIASSASVKDQWEHQRRLLIWALISDVCDHYRRQTMADILKRLDVRAKIWGIRIPKSLSKRAAEWDLEIQDAGVRRPK